MAMRKRMAAQAKLSTIKIQNVPKQETNTKLQEGNIKSIVATTRMQLQP